MDKQFSIVKTDYIVPASGDIIRGAVKPTIAVNNYGTNTHTTLAASEIGTLIVHTSSALSDPIALPVASGVTAYWGALPGDVFTTTVLNLGSVGQTFATNAALGIATGGNRTMAAYLGTTFQYVVGGTVAVPSATVYII